MIKFNINWEIIIYPSESGWDKIHDLTKEAYHLTHDVAIEWVNSRTVPAKDDMSKGYKDQLWSIAGDLHSMFFNGTPYFATINMRLIHEPNNDEPRYKTEEDKSLIYDSKTDNDVCMYFDDDNRDMLLNLLNLNKP